MVDRSSSGEVASRLTGRRLGEFVLGEPIGRGGFADVYRARQPSLERDAVIKVLRVDTKTAPKAVQHFEREARLASQLDHPFASHVYAFGAEPDGLLWIAMELVRGTSLSELVRTHGPIPIGRFVPVFERLCEVVHTAHGSGLIHRDIKPQNVMVITRAGRLMPKLLDFGLATLLESGVKGSSSPVRPSDAPLGDEDTTETTITQEDGQVSGTPAYMAPEQWVRAAHHDHRVDIYALGVLAYTCLTGRHPYHGKTPVELYRAHADAPIPSLGPGWSPAIDAVIAKALAKLPDQRYASTLELTAALQAAASGDEEVGWLRREDARPWLHSAPPHLAACVASLAAARTAADARDATRGLVVALAQWVGIVAIAARASLGHHAGELPGMGKLRRESLAPRDWLEVARALCAPFVHREELFPIPELVHWFASSDDAELGPDALLAVMALTRPDQRDGDKTPLHRDLLGGVLRGLAFIHGYTLLVGHDEWTARQGRGRGSRADEAIWISDGDRNRLFELSPLVASVAPAPGEALELFALAGGGRSGTKLVALPDGFEHETASVWPWLAEHFAAARTERPVTRSDRAPYRGLASFAAEDAELFFGRDRQLEALFNRVLLQPFVALTGPSGSGKSSLVHAGLVPRLPPDWFVISLRPGRTPVAALEAALAGIPVPESDLDARITAIATWAREAQRHLLIVVDQAEELLTVADRPEERATFAAALTRLASLPGDRVRIIITIRHDFIGRADELPAWREQIGHNLLLLTVPSREELAQMVCAPAAQAGYGFDDDRVISDMVDEVADRPGALPLLSFAASRLWDARDPRTSQLTRASYLAMGGVGGALARYAEETLSALSPRQQGIARELFRQLVTADGTKAPATRADLVTVTSGADIVLEHLIAARILVASEGADGHEDVAIIHEALLDRWPRLTQWRAEDAAGAHHRDELRAAAALWHQHAQHASYLWHGQALATYQTWAARWAGSLTATETAFARASVYAMMRARRLRRVIVGVSLATLSVAVLVLLSLNRIATTSRVQADTRLTDLLADRGRSELIAGHPLRALVYLNAAYERGRDGPGMRISLAQAARAVDREQQRVAAHHGVTGLVVSGDSVLSLTQDEPARLWRLADRHLTPGARFEHPGEYGEFDAALSASGSLIVTTGYQDRKLRVWDRDGKVLGTSEESGLNMSRGLAISPTEDIIACTWANTVALWDRHARSLGFLGTPDTFDHDLTSSIAFSNDGRFLARGTNRGLVEIWDPHAIKRVTALEVGAMVASLAFATDRLLISTVAGEVVVVSLEGAVIYRVQVSAGTPSFQVAPDLASFSTAGGDKRLRIWRLSDGHELAALEHAAPVIRVVYSPDGKLVAAFGTHSVTTLWDAQQYLRIGRIDVGGDVDGIAFSADSKTLISAGFDGRLKTWDTGADTMIAAFAGHANRVFAARFSPDGTSVASLGADGKIRRWRPTSGEQVGVLDAGRSFDSRRPVVFSPDGRFLAGQYLGDAAIWDLASSLRVNYFDIDERSVLGLDVLDHRLAVSSGGGDGTSTVTIWDTASERIVAHRTLDRSGFDLNFVGPGDSVALCTDKELMLWDVKTDKIRWTAAGTNIQDLEVSRDGSLVTASDSNGFVRIWRTSTGEVFRTLKQPASVTWSVALSPDNSLLAAASGDNQIYLWDIASGQIAGVLSGHVGVIPSVAFDATGTRLVSTGADGHAFVWSIAREERSLAELGRLIAERVPFRLEGAELVSTERLAP